MNAIGLALREKKKDPEWLAKQADVTPEYIVKLLKDHRRGSYNTLWRIAQALAPHVSFHDLLFRKLNPEPPSFKKNQPAASA